MKIKTVLFSVHLVLLFLSASYAGTIKVSPGRFDHFTLRVPERITAGEGFLLNIQAQDSYNNLIADFSLSGKEFNLSVSGSAAIQPAHLSPASFSGGAVNVTVTDNKAEKVFFSIHEVNDLVPVLTKEIVISPNKLDHFAVLAPDYAPAGRGFEVKIVAKDAFENTLNDVETRGKNISVSSVGTSELKALRTSVPDFKNGTADLTLVAEKAGHLSILVEDVLTGSKGQSRDIAVNPGAAGKTAETETAGKARESRKPVLLPPPAVKGPGRDIVKKPKSEVGKPGKAVPPPPVREAEKEPKKPDNKWGKIFSISDISILEADEKALIVIRGASSQGLPGYKDGIEKRDGREWLRIRMKPAVRVMNKTVDLASDLIGEVLVEEAGAEEETVDIYIEFKIAGPSFSISSQKNALIVMVSKTKR